MIADCAVQCLHEIIGYSRDSNSNSNSNGNSNSNSNSNNNNNDNNNITRGLPAASPPSTLDIHYKHYYYY